MLSSNQLEKTLINAHKIWIVGKHELMLEPTFLCSQVWTKIKMTIQIWNDLLQVLIGNPTRMWVRGEIEQNKLMQCTRCPRIPLHVFCRIFQTRLGLLRFCSLWGEFCDFEIGYQERIFQRLQFFFMSFIVLASILAGLSPHHGRKLKTTSFVHRWSSFWLMLHFGASRSWESRTTVWPTMSPMCQTRVRWVLLSKTASSSPLEDASFYIFYYFM